MKCTEFFSDSSHESETLTAPSSSTIATVLSSRAVGSGSESQNNPCWKGPLQVICRQPLACLGHICSGPHPVKIWGSPMLKNLQTLWATVPVLHYPQNEKKKTS